MMLSTLEKDQKFSTQPEWLPIQTPCTLQKIETQEYNIDHLYKIILALGFLEIVHIQYRTRLRVYKLHKRFVEKNQNATSKRCCLLKDQQLDSKNVSNDAYQNKPQTAQELHAEKPLSIRDQCFEKVLDAEHNDSQNQKALHTQNRGLRTQKHFSRKNHQLLQEQWREVQVPFSAQKDLEIFFENLATFEVLTAPRWKGLAFLFPLSLVKALSAYLRSHVIFSCCPLKISHKKTYLQILIAKRRP